VILSALVHVVGFCRYLIIHYYDPSSGNNKKERKKEGKKLLSN